MATEVDKGEVSRRLEALRAKGWSDLAIGEALDVDRVVIYRRRTKGKVREAQIWIYALRVLERRQTPS